MQRRQEEPTLSVGGLPAADPLTESFGHPFWVWVGKNQDTHTHKRHEGINVSTGITITNHTTAGRVVVHFPRVHVFGLWRSLSNSCPPLLGILCREYLHFCHRPRKFPVVRCRAGGIHFLFMITKRARTHRPHARTREYKWIWWRILKGPERMQRLIGMTAA